ncbi:hypothetical protein [Miltoncostaea oceani]|uniref:hypothetical protein n=1 Tax=Miltoncostaea oceani TaxID=2843216 RepID=UPI001C3D54D4|nr:hypothetical protein [Miltoncostaea oceani]
MTPIADRVATPPAAHAAMAAQAAAAAAARRPAADAASGGATPDGAPHGQGAPALTRGATGAPDPSGVSGRLVDVFA